MPVIVELVAGDDRLPYESCWFTASQIRRVDP